MQLSFGLSFEDLKTPAGIKKLDGVFLYELALNSQDLYNKLLSYRLGKISCDKEKSIFLIELAKYLEKFLLEDLFQIQHDRFAKSKHEEAILIAKCKRNFVQRIALKKYKNIESIDEFNPNKFLENFSSENFELDFAQRVTQLMDADPSLLADYEKYAAFAHYNNDQSVLFKAPKKYIANSYFEFNIDEDSGAIYGVHQRARNGFSLTDKGGDLNYVIDQANYCIYCHNQGKDSCSKGLKKTDGSSLQGCPLEEKISEMNLLKFAGFNLAAFAIALLDNPMIAATGHRICNDCMKSCIYQKQEPVDIPQIETSILKEVLSLPYGLEIYNLLTLWNPLSHDKYLLKERTGNKILIVGLGPAGFTLAHYLSREGHEIVAIDGLKIEPLDKALNEPIIDVNEIFED